MPPTRDYNQEVSRLSTYFRLASNWIQNTWQFMFCACKIYYDYLQISTDLRKIAAETACNVSSIIMKGLLRNITNWLGY